MKVYSSRRYGLGTYWDAMRADGTEAEDFVTVDEAIEWAQGIDNRSRQSLITVHPAR